MLEEPRKMTLERDAWGTELRRAFDLSDPRKEAEQLMSLIRRGILVAEVRRTIIISPGDENNTKFCAECKLRALPARRSGRIRPSHQARLATS